MRPTFRGGWHVPNDPKAWITWAHASGKLKNEKVFWVSTSSSSGRPHAAPVWGIWKRDSFYFETDPASVKGKNLNENPRIVVHVQDGLDTVIVEGKATRERNPRELKALQEGYQRKYGYKPNWSNENAQAVFRVDPRSAHAWRAPGMHRTIVNFLF
jgi:nitroimidazol reductase NimA-like FMN-containing flavoprotein (pyridoxamine 5'-phosphate oxidase superfamily)